MQGPGKPSGTPNPKQLTGGTDNKQSDVAPLNPGNLSLAIEKAQIPPIVAWPVITVGLATLFYYHPIGASTLIIPILYDELVRPPLLAMMNKHLGTT